MAVGISTRGSKAGALPRNKKRPNRPHIAKPNRTEEANRRGHFQLDVILESTADGILAVDAEGKVLKANGRFAELWRIPPPLLESGSDQALLAFVLGQLSDPDAFLSKVKLLYASEAADMDTLAFKDGRVFERYSFAMTAGGTVIGRVWSFRDITARRRAEAALRESEATARALLESPTDSILLVNPDGIILEANQTCARRLGRPVHELIGQSLYAFFADDLAQSRRRRVDEVVRRKVPVRFRDAREGRHLDQSSFPVFDAEGNVAKIAILARDVTEHVRSEEALLESERRFRDLSSLTSEGIMIHIDGVIQDANPAFAEFLGFSSPDDLVGKNALEIIPFTPESRERILDHLRDGSAKVYEIELIKPDGSRLPAEIRGKEISFRGGPARLISMRDISERKRAEEMLANSEKRFRQLAELLPQIVFETDLRGNITFANQYAVKTLGYAPEDVRSGIPIGALMAEGDRDGIQQLFREILNGGETSALEFQLIRKNGERFPVLLHANAILEDGFPIGARGIAIDISERKKAEIKIQETLIVLRKAFGGIIQVLSAASEKRDPYTAGHQRRVADLARAIAQDMGLAPDRVEGIRLTGVIHDVGKLSIPAEILSKPSVLSKIEYELIKSHAQIGHDILSEIDFDWPIAQIILQHHERLDGSGYPRGLKGDDILLEARILAVADVIEAMASHRPYRPALGIAAALAEIESNAPRLYDPAVAGACMHLFREKDYKLKD
jgi:PAS domain S-box-containing protein